MRIVRFNLRNKKRRNLLFFCSIRGGVAKIRWLDTDVRMKRRFFLVFRRACIKIPIYLFPIVTFLILWNPQIAPKALWN